MTAGRRQPSRRQMVGGLGALAAAGFASGCASSWLLVSLGGFASNVGAGVTANLLMPGVEKAISHLGRRPDENVDNLLSVAASHGVPKNMALAGATVTGVDQMIEHIRKGTPLWAQAPNFASTINRARVEYVNLKSEEARGQLVFVVEDADSSKIHDSTWSDPFSIPPYGRAGEILSFGKTIPTTGLKRVRVDSAPPGVECKPLEILVLPLKA